MDNTDWNGWSNEATWRANLLVSNDPHAYSLRRQYEKNPPFEPWTLWGVRHFYDFVYMRTNHDFSGVNWEEITEFWNSQLKLESES